MHLTRAFTSYTSSTVRSSSNWNKPRSKKRDRAIGIDQIREHASELAKRSADNVRIDVPVEYKGIVGDAAEEILRYADDQDARYIIVGSKKCPTRKALFGSVSNKYC